MGFFLVGHPKTVPDPVLPMETFTPDLAAAAELRDTLEILQTLETQLEAVITEMTQAVPGTAHHLSLSQRCVALQGKLDELRPQVERLRELAKSETTKNAEAEAAAIAAAAAKAAKLEADHATAVALVTAINEASDRLADALAAAAAVIPGIAPDLSQFGAYRLSGPWAAIQRSDWGGTGVIDPLPYVETGVDAALLTTRVRAGKR